MNKTIRYFACTVCICAIGVTITLNAVAVGSCSMTTDKFPFMCAQYPGKYCCSNGQTETNYSCPGGWTLNQSTRQCTRSSVTGSDEKGYTRTDYGSCQATETISYCCDITTTPISSADYPLCMAN